MPFQIKDFASIVAAQINHARSVTTKLTDFQPGSVARTLMEAPAVELEELYLQMLFGLRDAIPVATFLSFGFERLPASYAAGYVSVSANVAPTTAFSVLAGTVFTSIDGREFVSTEDVTWAAGATLVRIPVRATTLGAAGNIAAGVITASDAFGADYTVSNSAIVTGRDVETDAEREARFAEFVQSLSRGTVVACLYGARQARVLDGDGNIFEYVTRAGINEQPGYVRIYLYSNLGVPSAELLANGQTILDGTRDDAAGTITPGYRSAGVRVDVLPMVERAVSLSINVQMFPGYDFTPAVQQQLGDVFASAIVAVSPGSTLYLGTLIEMMLAVTGVRSIVPITTENIICAVNEALVPGALTSTSL